MRVFSLSLSLSFTGLETTVKNMLTSLRAVGELQNAAIRERHWEQLVKNKKNLEICLKRPFFILCLNFRLLLSKWNSSWPMIAVWQIFWDWIFITLKMKYIMLWIKLLKKWPWRKCSGIWSRLGPAWNLFMNCMPGLVVIF